MTRHGTRVKIISGQDETSPKVTKEGLRNKVCLLNQGLSEGFSYKSGIRYTYPAAEQCILAITGCM